MPGIDAVVDMTANGFVPEDFDPPTSLLTTKFRLEPLGPQHSAADHTAWMSSIEHIHATPGYPEAAGLRLRAGLANRTWTTCGATPLRGACGLHLHGP